ncbi:MULTISPECIES: 3'-5' exonuclease [unclassified Roseovarius]|uniref:3'-5' exonuclease n=1 Tax=unclassified Roseovarius TaxID=2614913 RepID=UPI00273FEF82|nr:MULTISPECIES: 3'-5' exonuclease [unclassified Roseovarius]
MRDLPLRLRVFLFFCLLGAGIVAVAALALWLGYRQLAVPEALSAFVTVGIVVVFGVLGLILAVWLLFDRHVSKPIEALAAHLRVRAHSDVAQPIDEGAARYLGDLAPAASAIHRKLCSTSETIEEQTARLTREKEQLLRILSDIPLAVILVSADHRIVLYDGQAAALMEREGTPRLRALIFDYLDKESIQPTLDKMAKTDVPRSTIAVTGRSGAIYLGHVRRFAGWAGYTLMLEPLEAEAARPFTYDFGLLEAPQSSELRETALRDLTYVIFDSETTGLNPDRDRVVQLAAVRVVNGRIVAGEVFDTLVRPGRKIPAQSTKVHRIDDAMVKGAPRFKAVCRDFHQFCEGAVIVAHNAPFDTAFLYRQAERLDIDFDHPVLDTVHLSAAVFGGSAEHTLDAICDRLEIEIDPSLRHTALGDAQATAEAFVKMIAVLEARGIRTFGDVQAEARKHSRILKNVE